MILAENKQVYHNYKVLETFEAGLVLSGAEVKSAKKGSIDLKGSYIQIDGNGEAWLVGAYIAPYKPAKVSQKGYDPLRNRKLLLKCKELRFFIGKQKEKKTSILALKAYLKNRIIKLEIGTGVGKKKHDKRESLKKRDFERKKRAKFAI